MPDGTGGLDALPSWAALRAHAQELEDSTLGDLFAADPARGGALTFEAEGLLLDASKQRVTAQTLELLVALAREAGLEERVTAMFAGEHVNVSEDRAALHVALRAPRAAYVETGGADVVPAVHEVLDRMADFAERVRSGAWTGATGERIRTVVNIGIGGSYLGPEMAAIALAAYVPDELDLRFLSNVDGSDFWRVTRDLDPASTLVIVASKTFTTLETMTNAQTMRDWIVGTLGEDTVARHVVAVSTNEQLVRDFGIDPANMFGFWDWVGGRYSMDSAIGLSTMIAIGAEGFAELLSGFHAIDEHLRETPLERNLPVLMGLLSVWNRNVLGLPTVAVLPYSQELARFPAYLQQLEMESNGKHVMTDGSRVRWETSPVLWGEPGTNGQHSFHQLLHQGTEIVPAELIAFTRPLHDVGPHHDLLLANLLGQAEALAFGRSAEELRALGSPEDQIPHRVCEGNRPSSVLLVDGAITPAAVGKLVALYEHRVLTEGVLWGIDSFDQWGVELGKVAAGTLADELTAQAAPDLRHDAATNALVRRLRAARGRPS